MGIGHFIVTVSGNLVDAVNSIVAQTCHLAGSYGRQQVVPDLEVNSMMEKRLSSMRMFLFAVAQGHGHFSVSFLEWHAIATIGM